MCLYLFHCSKISLYFGCDLPNNFLQCHRWEIFSRTLIAVVQYENFCQQGRISYLAVRDSKKLFRGMIKSLTDIAFFTWSRLFRKYCLTSSSILHQCSCAVELNSPFKCDNSSRSLARVITYSPSSDSSLESSCSPITKIFSICEAGLAMIFKYGSELWIEEESTVLSVFELRVIVSHSSQYCVQQLSRFLGFYQDKCYSLGLCAMV